MNTEVDFLDKYMQNCKRCLTIANINYAPNKIIQLLAVDPRGIKYHIELASSNSIADFEQFIEQRFLNDDVRRSLKQFGFQDLNHKKVIVAKEPTENLTASCGKHGIEVWEMKSIINQLLDYVQYNHEHFKSGLLATFKLLDDYKLFLKEDEFIIRK